MNLFFTKNLNKRLTSDFVEEDNEKFTEVSTENYVIEEVDDEEFMYDQLERIL